VSWHLDFSRFDQAVSCKDNYKFRWEPETKQGIEGKIDRFRSGTVRDRVRVRDKDRRSEAINFGAC